MRLLHTKTLEIASNQDIPKAVLSHAWGEVFKFIKSGQKHPKMFISGHYTLGLYLGIVYKNSIKRGCNFDKNKPQTLSEAVGQGFNDVVAGNSYNDAIMLLSGHFDESYLFSDACSLYYKGINIFKHLYGDKWRQYVPVESHKEILRQVTKTINK